MRNGQMSLFDVYDTNDLLDVRPCIFDRVDQLMLEDDTFAGDDVMCLTRKQHEGRVKEWRG
jgi:hypothetical protein